MIPATLWDYSASYSLVTLITSYIYFWIAVDYQFPRNQFLYPHIPFIVAILLVPSFAFSFLENKYVPKLFLEI